jgi:hypothetical protein
MRVRIIFQAEALERKSKRRGCRNGVLGLTGLLLLKTLAFRFFNSARGAAWPSYDTLVKTTGLCRQTIARAIRRLEMAGVLDVSRRAGWIGGRLVRETNVYRLRGAVPAHESLPGGREELTPSLPSAGPRKESELDAALAALGEAIRKGRVAT